MATASTFTAALVVNPAFLQEIKDSNPDLVHTLGEFRQVLRGEDPPFRLCRKLARTLDNLRDHLGLQFSLEESYGYLSVVEPPSLVLSELACRAHSQHGMLYMQLTDLAEQAEELDYRGVELAQLRVLLQRANRFERELREHEEAELELIERAYEVP